MWFHKEQSEVSSLLTLICRSLPSSDTSSDTPKPTQIPWAFGRPNLEISQTEPKLSLINSSALVRPSGTWKTVLLCFFLTDSMETVQSTLRAEWKDSCNWLMKTALSQLTQRLPQEPTFWREPTCRLSIVLPPPTISIYWEPRWDYHSENHSSS